MYFCAQVKTFPNSSGPLGGSYSDLIKRYKMNGSTTRKWRRNFNKGQVLHDCFGGPPLKSDNIMIAKIIERFQALESDPRADKGEAASNAIINEEYHIFLRRSAKVEPGDFIRVRKRPLDAHLDDEVVETLVPVADVKLDHRTVKRIREAANIR